jgi:hypothetical protein
MNAPLSPHGMAALCPPRKARLQMQQVPSLIYIAL